MAYPQVFEKSTLIQPLRSEMVELTPNKVRWTPEMKIFFTYFLVAIAGGAIRKWFTDSSAIGNAVLLLQMILPFLLYIFKSPDTKNPFAIYGVLPFYFGYLVFQILNPMQHTIFHGLLGMIIYGAMWIALFFYLANREKFDFKPMMIWFIIAATVEIVLGFIQYALPYDHVLNKYAQERHAGIAVIGDSVRITGTFSFLSGYSAYLIFHAFLVWALIRLKFPNWITILLTVFGITAAFMTGSRSAIVIYFAILAPAFLREFNGPQLVKFAGSLLIPMVIVIMLLIASGNKTVIERTQKASDNFWERTSKLAQSGEQTRRLTWGLGYFDMKDKFESPIFGVGAGATYQGSTLLFGKSDYVTRFGYVESEFVQIILEGGIIMFILRIILTTLLVLNLSFKGPIRWLIWFFILYAVPVVFNVHNAAFLMMGIMLVDNIIWRQQRMIKQTIAGTALQ